MAQKRETTFKNRIRPQLRKLPNSTWIKIQQVAIRGTSDLIGCVAGWSVHLELKASLSDKLDPLQLYHLRQMQKAGGVALAACPENWAEIYAYLTKLAEKGTGYAEGDVWTITRPVVRPSFDETGRLLQLQEPQAHDEYRQDQ